MKERTRRWLRRVILWARPEVLAAPFDFAQAKRALAEKLLGASGACASDQTLCVHASSPGYSVPGAYAHAHKRVSLKRLVLISALLCAPGAFAQSGSLGGISSPVVNSLGQPIAGANVAVCQPLATTGASVTSNLAVLTMASNPITAGFAVGMTIQVSGFTGGDTYFNGGTFTNGTGIANGFTILAVTSTTITYSLTHANASATTNGTVLQMGNSTTSCGGLSSVYSDQFLTQAITQPLLTDGLGNWNAFVADGTYYLQFYGPGLTTSLRIARVSSASKPQTSDAIQYVSANGNDSNDGLSWGTAKLTWLAAYNASPATGGQINVSAGTFPVALGTLMPSKPVRTICNSLHTTILQFTGASGNALPENYDSNPPNGSGLDWAAGFENCAILGPGGINGSGNAGTAFVLGDSGHSTIGFVLKNTIVAGFAIGIQWGNGNSWGFLCDHCVLWNNTQQMVYNLNSGIGCAQCTFIHPVFNQTTTFNLNSISFSGTLGGYFQFVDGPIINGDQVSISGSASFVIDMDHLDDELAINTTSPVWTQSLGMSVLIAPKFQSLKASGTFPASLINLSGGVMDAYGVLSTSAQTATSVVAISGSANLRITADSQNGVTALVSGSTTGFVNQTYANGSYSFGGNNIAANGYATNITSSGGMQLAVATKSTNYTLTTSDSWINVTGTTTITAPHAATGQRWVVFNSGSNTVTVQADSGNINGAANITLSANTGKEITCDGTNCFAH